MRKPEHQLLTIRFIVSVFFISLFTITNGQIVQFRGPNRDGIFPDSMLLKEWPVNGPELLFSVEGIGKGNSSTVATKERIYATGKIDSLEYLTSLDHKGNILWQKPYGKCWNKSFREARSTPTIDGIRIYVLTGMDNLTCFHAISGETIWNVDINPLLCKIFGISPRANIDGKLERIEFILK